jgi:hypothetical protein
MGIDAACNTRRWIEMDEVMLHEIQALNGRAKPRRDCESEYLSALISRPYGSSKTYLLLKLILTKISNFSLELLYFKRMRP